MLIDDKPEKAGRKGSLDSFQTETVREGKSQYKYSSVKSNIIKGDQDINYKELHSSLKQAYPHGHNRIKPWESYKMS